MPRRHRVALLTLFLPPDPSPDERAAGARNHGFPRNSTCESFFVVFRAFLPSRVRARPRYG
jgi:hypothetical protein